MTPTARTLAWQGVVATLVFACLVSLGLWQLRRLEWKEALIARIESRAGSAPVALPPFGEWASLTPDAYDWLHVTADGAFDPDHDILVFSPPPATAAPEPGYLVFTPFRLAQGGVIFVNRGFTPESKAKAAAWRAGTTGARTIRGLLRPPQAVGSFTPADDPEKGRWFTRDAQKFAAFLRLADVAPFTLDQDPDDGAASGLIRAAADPSAIPNNHLSYAVTWFGLAAALAGVFIVYARGRLRHD